MKGIFTLKKSAIIVAVCLAVVCMPVYSEHSPEKVVEWTKLLYEAVKNDDMEWVKICLNQGAYANARIGDGNTILMHAKSKEVAEVLIKAGADVNARNNYNSTVLMVVIEDHVRQSYNRNLKDIAEVLIKSGADVNARNYYGSTALMIVASSQHNRYRLYDVVELLIKLGADVKAQNNYGKTALGCAESNGNLGSIGSLLRNSK